MKFHIIPALILAAFATQSTAESFYKEPQLFSTAPSEKASLNTLSRFGPVGFAIELHQPAFTLHIGTIEPGSPAEAAGLQKGQIIDSINGEALQEIDPRIQLGRVIEKAEATDGILQFAIRGQAESVTVTIPILGAYSPTWPLNCPKSEKIVRNFADHLAKPGSSKGFADIGMLFLLSTGEEKDIEPVRQWVHSLKNKRHSGYAWHIGYGGLAICEYYLRTGDREALPVIQAWVDNAAKGEYLDAWAGRGGVTKLGYGNGHLNAAGTHVVTFLLLAKQCGVHVDESLLNRTLTHFFRYAGRGLNPYGDDRPETSFVDNGKNGKLAFAMAAAASLTPEGENSVYAKARDHAAKTSFYTTTFMLHGHTGGGIGEIWRSSAIGLLQEKQPSQYRGFMDHRKWHYDMSRHNDGQFSILGGAGYDKPDWGTAYALTYTIPRKTLRISGAPPSRFSKPFQLPARPWGTEADDIFLSLDPVHSSHLDVTREILARDSSKPLIERLNEKELTDEEIRRYLHHPDYLIRNMVSLNAAGLSCHYMFPAPGHPVRPHLLEEFAAHSDPRIRNAGIRAATKAFDPGLDWSQRLFALAIERLKDDAESWFVKDACLSLIQRGTPEMILPHIDTLLPYLDHSEQWLQQGALMALMHVATDERCFEKVLAPVARLLQTTPRQSTTGHAVHKLREILPNASEPVRALGLQVFGDAYVHYSGGDRWFGGQDLRGHQAETLERLAGTLAAVPGGYDVLYQLAKQRRPHEPLPYSGIFLAADPEQFGPDLREAIKPIIRDELIYQFIGQNRRRILGDINPIDNRRDNVTNSIDELVSLYQKIGVHDYDWKNFGPDLRNTEWHYFSFDPPEKQKYDISPWRYRPVTFPAGMENWFIPAFDAAKAGWQKGLPPFGQYQGELTHNRGPDTRGDTIWPVAPRTLWEHEVLLVRNTFEFPALKPGHLYRLRVDRGQGVGAGDGYQIFINGKPLAEAKQGLGRREGNRQRGGWITPEFASEFGSSPVTISAITFLRYGDRAIVQMPPVPQGIFSLWLEERQLPPLDEAVFKKAATFLPMFTSEWQATIDPESSEPPTDEGKFRYDGKFVSNTAVTGKWTTVAEVPSIGNFDPAARPNPGRASIRKIEFNPDGTTDSSSWIWSGTTLMNLETATAHKIAPHEIDGVRYLIIESGNFSPRHPAGWTTPLMVLKQPE
jgi:hypothetical protein